MKKKKIVYAIKLVALFMAFQNLSFGQVYPPVYAANPIVAQSNGNPVNLSSNPTMNVSIANQYVNDNTFSSIFGIISFQVIDRPLTVLQSDFTCEVELKVTKTDLNGSNSVENITLKLNYSPNGTLISYSNISEMEFQNVKTLKTELTGIKKNTVPTNVLPENLEITSNIRYTRYQQLTTNAIVSMSSFNSTLLIDSDDDGKNDKLKISWIPLAAAAEYQLEWAHINDYDHPIETNGHTTYPKINANNLPYDFRTNSTRISTSNTDYTFNLVFDRGWLIYRIRPLGININKPEEFVYGSWNAISSGNVGSLSEYSNRFQINELLQHESKLNWQYSAAYAEEAKKKEVVTYFDGTQRNRQMVTLQNSNQTAVVGETIYDYQGRPAITVLPTPVYKNNGSTELSTLKFYEKLNKQNGVVYGPEIFDVDAAPCVSAQLPLDSTNGASRYYSSNNPNRSGEQAYVPGANGYVYQQTEFTPDNSGKIRAQSGIGEKFVLNNGANSHSTRYLYGVPNQVELDRMFGSEVGNSVFYEKNAVVDPNGQVSISYLNSDGKVIATALAGQSPENLIELENIPEVKVINASLFDSKDDNKLTINKDGFECSKKVILTNPSIIKIDYNFEVSNFVDSCLKNICFQCGYDLTIQVFNECGENILKSVDNQNPTISAPAPLNKLVGNFEVKPNGNADKIFFTIGCNSLTTDTYQSENLQTNVTGAGEYTIVKKLTLNKYTEDQFLKMLEADSINNCLPPFQNFLDRELAKIDTTICIENCETCFEKLGSLAQYIESGKGTEYDYNEDLQDCNDLCKSQTETTNTSQSLRLLLQLDISPKGQYG